MSSDQALSDPALTVAVAMAAGMFSQAIGRHLKIPGIVVLLATGVLLGPNLLGVVQPDSMGGALHVADLRFKKNDVLYAVINKERHDEAEAWLAQMGWHPAVDEEDESAESTELAY